MGTADLRCEFRRVSQRVAALAVDPLSGHVDRELALRAVHDINLHITVVPQLRDEVIGAALDLIADGAAMYGDVSHDGAPFGNARDRGIGLDETGKTHRPIKCNSSAVRPAICPI